MHDDNDQQAPAGKRQQVVISQAASISTVQDVHIFVAVQQEIH